MNPRIIRILKISSLLESLQTHRYKSSCRPYEIGRGGAALSSARRHHSLSLHPYSNVYVRVCNILFVNIHEIMSSNTSNPSVARRRSRRFVRKFGNYEGKSGRLAGWRASSVLYITTTVWWNELPRHVEEDGRGSAKWFFRSSNGFNFVLSCDSPSHVRACSTRHRYVSTGAETKVEDRR